MRKLAPPTKFQNQRIQPMPHSWWQRTGSLIALLAAAAWLSVSSAHGQSLGTALDDVTLTWSTGGSGSWTYQTVETQDGMDAARSGTTGNSQSSWLETTVTGPGELSFYWRVSSEAGFDFLEFSVDDSVLEKISGKVAWTPVRLNIGSGTHTLRWTFRRDEEGSFGSDAGWVDQVSYQEVAIKPEFTMQPADATVLPGDRINFWAYANGSPYPTYQWQFQGANLMDETNSSLEITNISPSQAGEYRLVASNSAGSVTSRVAVVTVKTPVPIQRLGGWSQEPNGEARGVYVVNNLAYVANGSNGLAIINISKPDQAVRVGGGDTSGFAYDVVVAGQYAYVADGTNGLEVFNVANPTNCVRVGGCDVTNQVVKVAVNGNHAFLLDGYRLHVINVSNPTNCVYVTTTDNGGWGFALTGQHAFVANYGSGLRVLDVSNPTNCVRLNDYIIDYSLWAVAISGNHAYACSEWDGLVSWDISDPTNCVRLGACKFPGFGMNRSVAVSGNYAFVTLGKVEVVDISNPTNSFRAGVFDTMGDATDVAACGNYAYVADGTNGLEILMVGTSGVRWQPSMKPVAGQPLVLHFANADGSAVTAEQLSGLQIQVSEDLTGWSSLSSPLTLNNGSAQISDPQAATARCRFYRVLRQQ
ncbi:MAG TPA: immunoglobulin domain-containing protein [Clostridia bacterium]|nr:immunoglobulin domain-containing protein [Clostridia bacterium]